MLRSERLQCRVAWGSEAAVWCLVWRLVAPSVIRLVWWNAFSGSSGSSGCSSSDGLRDERLSLVSWRLEVT